MLAYIRLCAIKDNNAILSYTCILMPKNGLTNWIAFWQLYIVFYHRIYHSNVLANKICNQIAICGSIFVCIMSKSRNQQWLHLWLVVIVILSSWQNLCLVSKKESELALYCLHKSICQILRMITVKCLWFEPHCEKTGLRGFRPGPTQSGLYGHRW